MSLHECPDAAAKALLLNDSIMDASSTLIYAYNLKDFKLNLQADWWETTLSGGGAGLFFLRRQKPCLYL
ncbi:hypothetical protein PG988_012873 [Apiospora saccharicola]